MIDLALQACQHTINLSQQEIFHVVNLVPELSADTFLRNLHKMRISTYLITNPAGQLINQHTRDYNPKNMIFFLNEVRDVFNLILKPSRGKNEARTPHGSFLDNPTYYSNQSDDEPWRVLHAQKYSDAYGDFDLKIEEDAVDVPISSDSSTSSKSFILHIGLSELAEGSVLSDQIFYFTRHLYNHTIWNSENHLIFVLPRPSRSPKSANREVLNVTNINLMRFTRAAILVSFKAFWRFFRGLRVVICVDEVCYRYDPYSERILHYEGRKEEDYFDFSMKNLHGKSVLYSYSHDDADEHMSLINTEVWTTYTDVAMVQLQQDINCSFDMFRKPPGVEHPLDTEVGQKYDIDIIIFNGGADYKDSGYSKFDRTVGVETCVLCFVAPRQGFLPSCLVVFRSFSTPLWAIPIPVDALIIGTVYQSHMVTLLSNRVRIKDIDTVEELRQSNLYIQTPDTDSLTTYFSQHPEYKGLEEKLTTSFWSIHEELLDECSKESRDFIYDASDSQSSIVIIEESNNETDNIIFNSTLALKTSLLTLLDADAFLISVPLLMVARKNLRVGPLDYPMIFEFHQVGEYIFSYPFTFRVLKSSHVFKMLDKKLARNFECGLFISELNMRNRLKLEAASAEIDAEPRSFGMTDLQPAFLFLVIGLSVSSLVFLGEVFWDII
ncbi:unnamed protein product [Bemisia tabaci]|uniref:Ionotropic receptor n=1 Tax=Bemisia tabaci TaxID=7038 RepID=A0A9P0A8U6_BEMTA|nr:unnamed protein product [Bemisia tabaci]